MNWIMNLSRGFSFLHVPQLSFYLLSTKKLGGTGKSHNLFNAKPSTASLTNENSNRGTANATSC
jgi:hypothetical protein